MSKSKDELKELIKLLKKLLSHRYNSGYRPRPYLHRSKLYRPRIGGRDLYKPIRYGNTYARPQQDYRPKPEKPSAYTGKPWTEPQTYRPRERLVYDPEVKQILERIEKHLEPDNEEMPKQLEQNPELYDGISDRLLAKMSGGSEKLEQSMEADQDLADNIEAETDETENEPSDEAIDAEAIKDGSIDLDESDTEDDDSPRDIFSEDEADVLRDMEADELSDDEAVEPSEKPLETGEELAETPKATEDTLEAEPISELIIEAIEAQDLSPLEAELYPELEPLKAEEQAEVEGY